MTDAPQDESTNDDGSRMKPNGWAAWSKKADDPRTPLSDETSESPKTDTSAKE